MVYKATRLIKQEMDRMKLKYRIDEGEESSRVVAGFGVDNGPSVRVQFISRDDDNDVSVRLYGIVSNVADEKKSKILATLNNINMQYRFVKVLLDDDGDVDIEYDFPQRMDDASVGPACCEIFIRFIKIADEAYPLLMKAMWS